MSPDAVRTARRRTAMRIALAVVALLLAALLIFWAASEYIIRRDHRIAPVAATISSTDTPGARSRSTRPSGVTSMTARSVMMR